MSEKAEPVHSTKEKILRQAREEFLNKGYRDLSLRGLCGKLGLTTGSFYRYFPSKEALFDELVRPCAQRLNQYVGPVEGGPPWPAHMLKIEIQRLMTSTLINTIYDDYELCRLLFTRAQGSAYEGFEERLAARYGGLWLELWRELSAGGRVSRRLPESAVCCLAGNVIRLLLMIFEREMDRREALEYGECLLEYCYSGFRGLTGIDLSMI